jgi:hypothetical protein
MPPLRLSRICTERKSADAKVATLLTQKELSSRARKRRHGLSRFQREPIPIRARNTPRGVEDENRGFPITARAVLPVADPRCL